MEVRGFWHLGHVSDQRLRRDLAELLASGYRTEARIVAHIAEVEARKLHLKDGSESLFSYCLSRLGLSNGEAFHRITAARIARRFPVVFMLLEQRALHLTAVCLLRDYLTPENHAELLAEASHKTKLQVQELLARRFPRADVPSTLRKLPERRAIASSGGESPGRGIIPNSDPPSTATLLESEGVPPSPCLSSEAGGEPPLDVGRRDPLLTPAVLPRRAIIEPLSETRYRLQVNASSAFKEKLERFRALTSHSNPTGDIAVASNELWIWRSKK